MEANERWIKLCWGWNGGCAWYWIVLASNPSDCHVFSVFYSLECAVRVWYFTLSFSPFLQQATEKGRRDKWMFTNSFGLSMVVIMPIVLVVIVPLLLDSPKLLAIKYLLELEVQLQYSLQVSLAFLKETYLVKTTFKPAVKPRTVIPIPINDPKSNI